VHKNHFTWIFVFNFYAVISRTIFDWFGWFILVNHFIQMTQTSFKTRFYWF